MIFNTRLGWSFSIELVNHPFNQTKVSGQRNAKWQKLAYFMKSIWSFLCFICYSLGFESAWEAESALLDDLFQYYNPVREKAEMH